MQRERWVATATVFTELQRKPYILLMPKAASHLQLLFCAAYSFSCCCYYSWCRSCCRRRRRWVLNSQQLGGRTQHNNKSQRTTYAMTGTMPLETKTKTTTTTEMTTMKLTRRVTTIGDVTCSHRHWHKHSSSYQQQQQPWSSKRLCVLFFVLQLQQHAILPDYVCTNLHTYRYGVVCGSIINKITSTCALVCSMFGVHCLQQTQSILKQRDKIRHIHRHICTCERTK